MSYYTTGTAGLGSYYQLSGFGAISYNAEQQWSDQVAGANGDNFRGKRSAEAMQAALNQLGYGPIGVDGAIGNETKNAIKRFSRENMGSEINWPTKALHIKIEELLSAGDKPGSAAAVEYHKVGDTLVAGAAPGEKPAPQVRASAPSALAKAGLGTGAMVGIGVGVLVLGLGAFALFGKKRKPPQTAVANRRRRRRARRNMLLRRGRR